MPAGRLLPRLTHELTDRLDRWAHAGRSTLARAVVRRSSGMADHVPQQEVRVRLRELLDQAGAQDEEAGRAALLHQAVAHLVPDEARILDALSRHRLGDAADTGMPLIHIHCLTATGLAGEPALENASLVGRRAGVSLPRLTPYYLTRLLALGLLEIGPEDPRLADGYQALLADPFVLASMSRARAEDHTPKVVRHTVRLSPLGQELCGEPPGP